MNDETTVTVERPVDVLRRVRDLIQREGRIGPEDGDAGLGADIVMFVVLSIIDKEIAHLTENEAPS